MKKITMLSLGVLVALSLCACNNGEVTIEEKVLDDVVEDSEMLGMPNPMKNISSDNDFYEVTGFSFDSSKLSGAVNYENIIDDDICQVAFSYPYGDREVNCVFRGRVMDAYLENMQGIFDEIESSNHIGYGLGEEIIDLLEIKYVNTDCIVYEFLVDDNAEGITKQCSLEIDSEIDDEALASLMESVLWAMNAFNN